MKRCWIIVKVYYPVYVPIKCVADRCFPFRVFYNEKTEINIINTNKKNHITLIYIALYPLEKNTFEQKKHIFDIKFFTKTSVLHFPKITFKRNRKKVYKIKKSYDKRSARIQN